MPTTRIKKRPEFVSGRTLARKKEPPKRLKTISPRRMVSKTWTIHCLRRILIEGAVTVAYGTGKRRFRQRMKDLLKQDGMKRAIAQSVMRTRAMSSNGCAVLFGRVSFMLGESVHGKFLCKIRHKMIARHFCDNRCSGN